MKKGKVFSKKHIITATLTVCLAAAVWLNMKYSSFTPDTAPSGSDLGNTKYLDDSQTLGEAVATSAGQDRIAAAKADRDSDRNASVEKLKAIINDSSADSDAKAEALAHIGKIADNISLEASIETVIKAKGFEEALAVVSPETVTVIVPKDTLLTSETLQIQDAVASVTDIDLEKIKIITVK